ncbi:hypothetical protein IGI37_000915 [Enterococcus sp. AZ194]|uniref:sensor histidine kinase n=1 Tax=Enterococcus sp. AZ194 TaxID=2774629 RepID=UPI003F2944F3
MIKTWIKQYWIQLVQLGIAGFIVGLAYYYTQQIGFSLLVLSLLFLFLLLAFCERRRYERIVEGIGKSIQTVFEEGLLENVPENRDELVSKVYKQLQRLEETVISIKRSASKDKNSIQKLITEIAHQLRTPLVSIETYLEILKLPDVSESEKRQAVNALEASQKKISFLVESFIKMSRLDQHLIQLKNANLSLKETVVGAVFQLHKQAEFKEIEVTVIAPTEIILPHDKNWLGEAFYNLIDNSIKYSPKHSTIEIELIDNEMFAQINIRDYGIGIEKEEEANLYQRFYRGKNVTTQEGFGIGLYTARRIIMCHKGLMNIKREQPGLSTTIYLPK